MTFGHRGINVPVIDHATGRVAITAQNLRIRARRGPANGSTPTSGPPS